jgi:hypothetical protein
MDTGRVCAPEIGVGLPSDKKKKLPLPPKNISLFLGNSLEPPLHESIARRTGLRFQDFDIFYTYLTLQQEFADLIRKKAKRGALFMVYGLEKILPRHQGLRLLTPEAPLEGVLALYRKE